MILFKFLQIVFHILYGVLLVLCKFKSKDPLFNQEVIKKWCKQALVIFGVELEVRGKLVNPEKGVLLVANHISWLDIIVINAWQPMRFVAKLEVANWPVFGWFAKQVNTLFIDRQSRGHSKEISTQMSKALESGDLICIFPEGTSSDGSGVLSFRPNLFQAAIDANVSCQPLAISYQDANTNLHSSATAFIGDMGLLGSIRNTLHGAPLKVVVQLSANALEHIDRKALSEEAWREITSMREQIN